MLLSPRDWRLHAQYSCGDTKRQMQGVDFTLIANNSNMTNALQKINRSNDDLFWNSLGGQVDGGGGGGTLPASRTTNKLHNREVWVIYLLER